MHIGIATNQAGILWKMYTGKESYPDAQTLVGRLLTIAHTLYLEQDLWILSIGAPELVTKLGDRYGVLASQVKDELLALLLPHLPQVQIFIDILFRKPNPGMLLQAQLAWGMPREAMYYVGDMETDEQAAQNAGIDFVPAEVFWQELPEREGEE